MTTTIKRKRHQWPDNKITRTEWYTIRHCPVCGLEKWTDHNERFPLVYYKLSGETVNPMPECDYVE